MRLAVTVPLVNVDTVVGVVTVVLLSVTMVLVKTHRAVCVAVRVVSVKVLTRILESVTVLVVCKETESVTVSRIIWVNWNVSHAVNVTSLVTVCTMEVKEITVDVLVKIELCT